MASWTLRFQRLLLREEHEARKLLGDGAAALARAAGLRIAEHRPGEAAQVDAAVLVETAVLDRHDGLREMRRQIGRRQLVALEHAARGEGLAVVGLEHQGALCRPRPAGRH